MTRNDLIHAARTTSKPGLLLAMLCASLLGACQTTQPQPVAEISYAPVPVPAIAPVNMRDVSWKVYNVAELEKLVAEKKAKPEEKFVLIAVTPKGYENLSLNLTDLERYIREQKKVVYYLKKTIDDRAMPNAPAK
jgi:hypothetical protein